MWQVQPSPHEPGPSTCAGEEPGLEYKNVTFQGEDVIFKNDYKVHTAPVEENGPGTQYADVEFVVSSAGQPSAQIQPVCNSVL